MHCVNLVITAAILVSSMLKHSTAVASYTVATIFEGVCLSGYPRVSTGYEPERKQRNWRRRSAQTPTCRRSELLSRTSATAGVNRSTVVTYTANVWRSS